MKKNLVALLISAVLLLTTAACNIENPVSGSTSGTDGKIFSADTELDIMIRSFISYPYDENWAFWRYLRETVGGKLNVQAVPTAEFDTKVSLMMASPEDMPDLLNVANKFTIDSFALSGAFIAVEDNIDKLPNYKAFWDTIPEPERSNRLKLRLSGDGKTYFPQVHGTDRMSSNQVWIYRKDIFEKHDLKVPETMDELYEVSLALKKLYPDSYPFAFYNFNKLATIGPAWAPYFQHYVYYDFNNDKWLYGAQQETMRDIVEFFIELRREGLIAPDFMTMTTKAWEELINTDRGFIMPSYTVRIDSFNLLNRERNPDYTWAAMIPPRANNETGQNLIARTSPSAVGYAVCNTRDDERIANAFRLVDWMYTEEAVELLSWGREGETYTIENGERRFLVGEGEIPRDKYGLFTSGLYQRIDPAAAEAAMSFEERAVVDLALSHMEERNNPKFWMAFSDEEMVRREQVRSAIEDYTDEMLSKFILELVPMSEWDTFQKTLIDLEVEELIAVHKSAYQRVLDVVID